MNNKRKVFNQALLALSLLALAGTAVFLALYWRYMPEEIPTHFNAAGQIDGWGPKSSILLLPIVGAVMFGVFQFTAFIISNMKDAGAARPLRAMEVLCRSLCFIITLMFAYTTVCSALCVSLGRWFTAAFIGATAAVTGICIIIAFIAKRK